MTNSYSYGKDGLALTEGFEGCRLSAYQDSSGVWTIGYGHTGSDVHAGLMITEADAEGFLLHDIAEASGAVNRLVTIPITQDEHDALADFVFNAGSGAFEHSTLLRDLNAGNFAAAITQFELWDHASGLVVVGLLRRRQAEAELFAHV